MNADEMKGKFEQAKGAVKQKAGELTDDPVLHDEGVADQAEGELREGAGRVRRKVGEAVEEVGERIKR
jgi:uncharacterized protein YjbJ (UPF0337 family)